MTTIEAFQVDLGGVVEILSRHLYSSPRVFLRELLQNAVDAVHARRLAEPGSRPGTVRIVPAELAGGGLEVHDDGVGLDAEDVRVVLSTVGRSSKRDPLGLPRSDFLGQFGIGLLSCFLVTDEIRVTSRRAGAEPVEWIGRSDGTFRVGPPPGAGDIGTVVRLTPRAGAAEPLFAAASVIELARHVGAWLPVTIRVDLPGGGEETVSETPPWDEPDPGARREALLALGREMLGAEPFDVVPLRSEVAGVRGAAFVLPSGARPGPGTHRLHVRRMLVTERSPDVLPEWAFWVRAVIDADTLALTAGREAVMTDEVTAAVAEHLGGQLRRWVVDLATTRPVRFAAFLDTHSLALKSMAVHDDDLYRLLVRHLPFETTLGDMSLTELRARVPVIRYATTVDAFREVAAVASAQGIGVVNGGYTYDTELVRRLPDVVPGAVVAELSPDDVLDHIGPPDPEDPLDLTGLGRRAAAVLDPLGVDVEVRAFEPVTLPALHVEGDRARLRRHLDDSRSAASGVWGGVVEDLGAGVRARPVLCLNARNAVVRRLVAADGTLFARAVEVVYVQTLLLGRRPLRATDLALAGRGLQEIVTLALEGTGR